MPEVRIAAEPRTEFGKGGARRTRRAGNIPAVLYGHGTDPRHISLPTRAFESALRTDGANVLLEVAIDGDTELALPKSIQRDPVRGVIEHIDLILVRRGEQITVDVLLQVSSAGMVFLPADDQAAGNAALVVERLAADFAFPCNT